MRQLIAVILLSIICFGIFIAGLQTNHDGWAFIGLLSSFVCVVWLFAICFVQTDHTQTQIYKPNEYSYMIVDNSRAIIYLKSTQEILQFTNAKIVNELSDSSSFVVASDYTITGIPVAENYSILRYKNNN